MSADTRLAVVAELGLVMGAAARADEAHVDGDIDRAKRIINDLVLTVHTRREILGFTPRVDEIRRAEMGEAPAS